MAGEFCDTNVVVYAYDSSAGQKHEQARALLQRLWRSGDGVVSVQVLQELFATLTRKLPNKVQLTDARAIVADMATWRTIALGPEDVIEAIDITSRSSISIWDALIVRAASLATATTLWSEDLNHGQRYDGVVVRNPFAP